MLLRSAVTLTSWRILHAHFSCIRSVIRNHCRGRESVYLYFSTFFLILIQNHYKLYCLLFIIFILDNQILPSVILVLRNQIRIHVVCSERRLQGKLAKLSERQDKLLRASNEKTVSVLDNIILRDM